MKERVYKLLGLPSYDDCSVRLAHGLPSYDDYSSGALNIGTFHSTCLNIIRENTELCGLKKRFVIYDDKDQTVLLKSIMKEMEIDGAV